MQKRGTYAQPFKAGTAATSHVTKTTLGTVATSGPNKGCIVKPVRTNGT